VKAVILCGGQGTRIRDVADDVPKPMIRIGDRPILWHIMKTYAAAGISEFVLCLGYRGWMIKEFLLNYHAFVADRTATLEPSIQASDTLGFDPTRSWPGDELDARSTRYMVSRSVDAVAPSAVVVRRRRNVVRFCDRYPVDVLPTDGGDRR